MALSPAPGDCTDQARFLAPFKSRYLCQENVHIWAVTNARINPFRPAPVGVVAFDVFVPCKKEKKIIRN